jgi:hypothetical protein
MAAIDLSMGGCDVRVRLIFALTLSIAALGMLGGATGSQAAPGSLRILITTNISYSSEFSAALAAKPGVAGVDTFHTNVGTPSPETLATYDVVASLGDTSYQDTALWGDRLAGFIDAGGVFVQYAYDNWDNDPAHPAGRFESGGYQAFIPGPDDALSTTFGEILVPSSPLLAGVPSFTTSDNTTPTVAPGATLLARWNDGREAIATKGRVLSIAASPQDASLDPMSAAAQLAVNAGNVLAPKPPTGQRAAALKKCKKKNKKHHNKKKFKKCKKKANLLPV